MENLREQYAKTIELRKKLLEQINTLKNDEKVKEYFRLCKENEGLIELQRKLYKDIKFAEYSNCSHIWIIDLHDYDSWEGRSYNTHGCIKCGLDYRVFRLKEQYHDIFYLPLEQQVMYEYLTSKRKGNKDKNITTTRIMCDLDLGTAIYAKIKEAHPNIDDDTALIYFKKALSDIRNIKVSDERKASRARRLSLKPKFNKWTGHDVQI